MPSPSIAELTLHETTHVVYREGTVGFWKGVEYYLETIFLLRYSTHSAERHPNATSEEFEYFMLERNAKDSAKPACRERFERHLAQSPTPQCNHGNGKENPRARL
jgi:hypothetical protein